MHYYRFFNESIIIFRKCDVNPIFGFILKPLSRVFAILVGRGIKKWWSILPPNKKQLFFHHVIKNKYKYAGKFLFILTIKYYLPVKFQNIFLIFDIHKELNSHIISLIFPLKLS